MSITLFHREFHIKFNITIFTGSLYISSMQFHDFFCYGKS